ncbi:unnamed protein product [Didymodactylos carnosus]|uniref:Chitin-binding type-2 domain-containing protein n=1 Tax=Didymodactylos carnosus TaxID=1234261 RepID=A0A814RCX8_9BILA|nr:unnamed protein product [Didymodactylos carnosus]CAF1131781.1 unnamed protein product [Didymodactylos carnosus]CAF3782950.1 unnamed protein product [Didymodactylos carnosus]CAF3895553.1 unnamed protein product [Didymodactylos carnosus]
MHSLLLLEISIVLLNCFYTQGLICPTDGLFSNPTDETTFYICSNSYPYLLNCPNGLIWSDEEKICQYPQNVLSTDKFEDIEPNGNVLLTDDGRVAKYISTKSEFTEVRGQRLYSSGTHKIHLKIDQIFDGEYGSWMFIGIISSKTRPYGSSHMSQSSYGWTIWENNKNMVYLNGRGEYNYRNYDNDIKTHDELILTIDCDKKQIRLWNNRTNKQYVIDQIDYAPLPWQLHINLGIKNDQIRILRS